MTQSSNVSSAQEIIESAVAEQKPRRGCWGCLYGCLTRGGIAMLILAVPFWYFCLYAPPLRISKETTYVLGPKTADGKHVDYFRALEELTYPAEMKTDDNGYRMLVRCIGVGDATSEDKEKELVWRRPQIYAKLGLDPLVAPTLSLVSPDAFFGRRLRELDNSSDAHKELKSRRDVYAHSSNPWRTYWSREDFPVPPEWLEENTAGLDLLGEAVRKLSFCVPYVRENDNETWNPIDMSILPDIQRLREFARACQGRAVYRIGSGDIDGAIDDTITLYRLGRHAGKQPTLISWLVGIAIEGMASSIDIAGNPACPPSRAQWERLRSGTEIITLPTRRTCAEALASERLFGVSILQFQMSGQADDDAFPLWIRSLFLRMTLDQNVLFQTLNKGYDKMTSVAQGTSDGETIEMWLLSLRPSYNPLRWLTTGGRSEQIGSILLQLLLPAVQAAREAERRAACAMNLKQLTIALMLYEKDHGAMPDGDWREAIRPYLGGTSSDDDPDQFFRCPSHPNLAADETTYAMIRREDDATSLTAPYSLLLVELRSPMKLSGNDGTITEATARATDSNPRRKPDDTDGLGSYHAGGYNVSLRGGGVMFFLQTLPKEKLAEAIAPPTPTPAPPTTPVKPLAKLSDDFERAVQKYEEASKVSPPEPGCMLFVGSSSFALWGKKLEEAFADRNAVNRGFGGSTFPDNLLAIDRIHIPCRPARVVIFCGTNDFARGASVDEVFANFREYLARLWDADSRIEVFFVSLTHAPAREHLWAKGDALNALIQELAGNTSGLTVIDIITPMNAAIERGEELFVSDRLHLNDAGYAIWTQAFREAFAAQDARNAERNTPAESSLSE